MNIQLLSEIESNSSRLMKESLLKQADKELRHFLELALDQDVTFGVTVGDDQWCEEEWARANRGALAGRAMPEGSWTILFRGTLEKCRTRAYSGGSAENAVLEVVQRAPSSIYARYAGRIINRNLRLGFDKKTYDRVFGEGSIQKFEVQLAETYDPEKHELKGLWFYQPKLDGNRVVLIDGKAMSRGGKEYAAARPFVEAVKRAYPNFFARWVLDGEMMGNLGFDQSSGALRRFRGEQRAQFTYWVFDAVSREEWENRETRALIHRRSDVERLVLEINSPNIQAVPTGQLHGPTPRQVAEICREFVVQGFEGAMLKDAESGYVWDRGDNLLKVKEFFDDDLRVTGFYEGKGKHKGRLGGVWVEGTIKGKKVRSKCGSGFDDGLREAIWDDQKGWLGATVQVQHQGVTPKNALRFPVFVMRRKDKES